MKNEYQRRRVDEFNAKWRDDVNCSQCGRNPFAEGDKKGINWHHVDPATKSFHVVWIECYNKTVVEILTERNKCVPLCHGCHRRLHNDKGKGYATDRNAYDRSYRAEHRDEINAKQRARYARKKSLIPRQV